MSQPTRNSTSRAAGARPVYGDDFRGKLHISAQHLDQRNFEYKWAVEAVLGEPQPESITENLERGWHPVPADKNPQLVPPTLEGMPKPPGNYVRRGSQILMMRPKQVGDAELAAFQKMNRDIVRSVDKDRVGDGRNIETTREVDTELERNGSTRRFQDA